MTTPRRWLARVTDRRYRRIVRAKLDAARLIWTVTGKDGAARLAVTK